MLMESLGPVNLKSQPPSHRLEETVNKEAGNQESGVRSQKAEMR
jgi:hypothetical protein